MSHEMNHVSVRAKLPELANKSYAEVLPFFRDKCGEPTVFCDEDDWCYDGDGHILPVRCDDTNGWGVEWLLVDDLPHKCEPANIAFNYLEQIRARILEEFPTATDFMVCSYTWYNGTDEPVSLEPNFGEFKE